MTFESMDMKDRIIKQDQYRGFFVSTVKLPIMHGTPKCPEWFETIVFGEDRKSDYFMARCETEDEAVVQHIECLHWVNENFEEITRQQNHDSRS